jgi:hypothetical protein
MTAEADAGHVAVQLSALDQRYIDRWERSESLVVAKTMAQKMAELQRDCEARVHLQVSTQVRSHAVQNLFRSRRVISLARGASPAAKRLSRYGLQSQL